MKPHEPAAGITRGIWTTPGRPSVSVRLAQRVSDAVNGKRAISKSQAKRLGAFFSISPAAII